MEEQKLAPLAKSSPQVQNFLSNYLTVDHLIPTILTYRNQERKTINNKNTSIVNGFTSRTTSRKL